MLGTPVWAAESTQSATVTTLSVDESLPLVSACAERAPSCPSPVTATVNRSTSSESQNPVTSWTDQTQAAWFASEQRSQAPAAASTLREYLATSAPRSALSLSPYPAELPDRALKLSQLSTVDADLDSELGKLRLRDRTQPTANPSAANGQSTGDPELGKLRLQEQPLQAGGIDSELGILRLEEKQRVLPPPQKAQPSVPTVYLLARLDYFQSSNVFAGIDPVDDGLFRPGLTLYAIPSLGRDTYLSAAIDASMVRYGNQSEFNYNELRFRAGVLQRLTPRTYGEIGWTNQQLYSAGAEFHNAFQGQKFYNENAFRLELSRQDPLNSRLNLYTYYQFRVGLTEPDSRSRLIHTLYTSLSYQIQPQLQVSLDYQFAFTDFIQQQREDFYHQIATRLSYNLSRRSRLSMFAGVSLGNSSNPNIDFDSFIFGASFSLNVPLF